MVSKIPPSGEVIAEEIQVRLDEAGLLRDEQGSLVRNFVRVIADEISELLKMIYRV